MMTQSQWLVVGLGAGAMTYLFRAAPFTLPDTSIVRRPKIIRFATLTSLAVTAGLVATTIIGKEEDIETTVVKLGAVLIALWMARRFQSTLLPLFTAVALASIVRYLLEGM